MKTSGLNIYTIEELCYCLRMHLDMLDESIIDREMARFISDELGLKERGELLEKLIITQSDLKSRLVAIFCSCDYYTEDEINEICREFEIIMKLPPIGRRKRRADRYMHEGYVTEAQREYRSILADRDGSMLTPEEYGTVLHNLGVIDGASGMFESAAELFREAYERNSNPESLKAYLFALKLGRHEEAYNREIRRLVESSSFVDDLEHEFEIVSDNVEQSGELSDVNRMKVLIQQGRTSEYERLADEMIALLKNRYRR